MSSPFEVLGVGRDADDEAVVEAYRRRVKETHPDHGGSTGEFQAVQQAYEEILDDDEEGGERRYPATSRVEYLNYTVLADRGWSLEDDPFARAATADLAARDHGEFAVHPPESLLEAAERCGFAWPYACRGGACANCAVAIIEGELSQPVDHILPAELLDRDIRLSCNGVPLTEHLRVVYNVKYLPDLEELRLPPHPFTQANPNADVGTD